MKELLKQILKVKIELLEKNNKNQFTSLSLLILS